MSPNVHVRAQTWTSTSQSASYQSPATSTKAIMTPNVHVRAQKWTSTSQSASYHSSSTPKNKHRQPAESQDWRNTNSNPRKNIPSKQVSTSYSYEQKVLGKEVKTMKPRNGGSTDGNNKKYNYKYYNYNSNSEQRRRSGSKKVKEELEPYKEYVNPPDSEFYRNVYTNPNVPPQYRHLKDNPKLAARAQRNHLRHLERDYQELLRTEEGQWYMFGNLNYHRPRPPPDNVHRYSGAKFEIIPRLHELPMPPASWLCRELVLYNGIGVDCESPD